MSIKSFMSIVFTCTAAAAFVLTMATSGQALELCAKADKKGDPTQPKDGSPIKLRSACKAGKEVSLGTTDALSSENSLPCASQVGDDVIFDGCNVHVRSGSGATDGDSGSGTTVNGLGNLIVGYDEDGGADDKTGSHNLVVGELHSYTSFGGLVAGYNNDVSGEHASVSGGDQNTASGYHSSVCGGYINSAQGFVSSVTGGSQNKASGSYSSINGGLANIAGRTCDDGSGVCSQNSDCDTSPGAADGVCRLGGSYTLVGGGSFNNAVGHFSTVSGGGDRTALDSGDWVAGGLFQDD